MSRKKAKDQSLLLSNLIRTRVTEAVYRRLHAFVGKGDCHSIGEVARRILSKEKIVFITRDNSLDLIMEELIKLRLELNSIGVNINQITHHFHLAGPIKQKTFQALKVAEQYKQVGDKVDRLLVIVSQLAKKWLQK